MMQLLRLRNAVVLMLVVILTNGCGMPFLGGYGGAATPQDAARQAHSRSGPGTISQNFTILGSRTSGRRAVVLSTETMTTPGQPSPGQVFSIDIITMDSGGWTSLGTSSQGGTGLTSSPIAPALMCGGMDLGVDNLGAYSIVYGRVRQPDVAAVEIDFISGTTLKDTTGDGLFAVIVSKPDTPTKLRLLNANGQTIHSVTLPQSMSPNPAPAPQPPPGGSVGYSQSQSIECSP